jgi:SAM-dependent methyltransferase
MVEHVCFLEYLCPVCDSQLISSDSSWIFKCESCGLLASNLNPHIPNKMGDSVIDEASREIGLVSVREQNNSIIIDQVRKYVNGSAKLLDVGSGLGFFLAAAKKAGFSAIGIEPDANVVERTGQENVRKGYFPDALNADEKFDVIVFNDVLEHIPDAFSAVLAARRHLVCGGVLVLNCPDRKGIFYRLASLFRYFGASGAFDRLWQKHTPSPHRWYFTRNDLFQIGKKCGFSPLATVELVTLSGKGLSHRIFHLKGQSKLVGIGSLVAAYILLPFLRVLPSDLGVAILQKTSEE